MEPITVLFFGSQGSGKGTQAHLLIQYLKERSDRGVISIDMGQLLRDTVAAGSFSGQLINEFLSRGERIYDFLPIYLQTKELVEKFTGNEHIIADGLARGHDQTAAFDDAMRFFRRDNFQVISLELSEESVVKRLKLRGREDDTDEGIRNRLRWYHTDVLPQMELLKSRGRVIHHIDAEPDPETIHREIVKALGLA